MDFPAILRLIIVDSNQLFRMLLTERLRTKYPAWEIHEVANVDSALRIVVNGSRRRRFRDCPASEPNSKQSGTHSKTLFMVGCCSYLKQIRMIQQLKTCCPRSRIILMDQVPKFGCSLVVHHSTVHGYITTQDTPDTLLACLDDIANDKTYHSSCAEHLICRDPRKESLSCHSKLCEKAPHSFSEIEWRCFEYLLAGRNLDELANAVKLKSRSIRNMKYRLMKKLNVGSLVEMLRLAHCWGVLDD